MTTSKNSPGDSGSDTGSNSWLCPECGTTDISRSGASGHLRWKHDYSAERAKREIRGSDPSSGVASVSNSPTSGGVGGFGGDVPDSMPEGEFGETADHVARRMRQVADVSASQKMLESMNGDGGGSDGDSAERIGELKRELRSIRDEVRGGSPAQSGGGDQLVELAQLARDENVDKETLTTLAELGGVGGAHPEVRKEELRVEREQRKAERRREMFDSALGALEDVGDRIGGSAVEAVAEMLTGGGSGGGRRESRREPAREPDRAPERPREPQRVEQPEQTAQPRGADPGRSIEGDSRIAQDGGQPARSAQQSETRDRYERLAQEAGADVEAEADGAIGADGAQETDDEAAQESDETDDETDETDTKYSPGIADDETNEVDQ